jgi:hypothetical protein
VTVLSESFRIRSALIIVEDSIRLQRAGKTIGDVFDAASENMTLSEAVIIRQAWGIANSVREMVKV